MTKRINQSMKKEGQGESQFDSQSKPQPDKPPRLIRTPSLQLSLSLSSFLLKKKCSVPPYSTWLSLPLARSLSLSLRSVLSLQDSCRIIQKSLKLVIKLPCLLPRLLLDGAFVLTPHTPPPFHNGTISSLQETTPRYTGFFNANLISPYAKLYQTFNTHPTPCLSTVLGFWSPVCSDCAQHRILVFLTHWSLYFISIAQP